MDDKDNTLIPDDVSDFSFETDDFSVGCISKIPESKTEKPVLIENLLHQGHSMLLYGPAKSYKSFLLLMLCMAIATGTEWLGQKCSQGNVLIIEFENGEGMVLNRIKQILNENGLDETCLSRISILSAKNSLDINSLADGLIKNIPPKLYSAVIIDPIYSIMNGSESQAEFVDEVFNKIDELAKKTETSVILCHHTKKETQSYQSMVDRISGSSIIGRNIPSLVCISSVYEKDGYCREKIQTKLRHFPQQPPFYINIKGPSYTIEKEKIDTKTDSGSSKNSKDSRSDKTKDLIRFCSFLKDNCGTVKISQLEELMGVSKNTLKKYIDETPGFSRDSKGIVAYTEPKET